MSYPCLSHPGVDRLESFGQLTATAKELIADQIAVLATDLQFVSEQVCEAKALTFYNGYTHPEFPACSRPAIHAGRANLQTLAKPDPTDAELLAVAKAIHAELQATLIEKAEDALSDGPDGDEWYRAFRNVRLAQERAP